MFMAIAVSFGSVPFYFANTAPEDVVFEKEVAWRIIGSLGGAWLVVFGLFLKLMKPGYRRTFISTQTGNQWAQSRFLEGDKDKTKASIVRFNGRLWKSIRPQVKEWFLENWNRWEEQQPEWFDPVLKRDVDDDFITGVALERIKIADGGTRRRSSLAESLGGGDRRRSSMAQIAPEPPV
jgi:hypothetical protein